MIFLCILLVIAIICTIIACLKFEISIKNLNISIPKQENRYINPNYEIIISLYIFKKLKILKFSITKTFLEKQAIDDKIKNLEKKIIKDRNSFDVKAYEIIKKLNIKIEQFDLSIKLGTTNAACTAILVGISSTILGIIFRFLMQKNENQKFNVIPIYQDKNILKINFEGIFQINLIHIIYIIIYVLKQKRSVNENGRTSNRRSYAYSDE